MTKTTDIGKAIPSKTQLPNAKIYPRKSIRKYQSVRNHQHYSSLCFFIQGKNPFKICEKNLSSTLLKYVFFFSQFQ